MRAGTIYSRNFGRCLEARRCFEAAARRFPDLAPWAERAKSGLLSCPDYFPLERGNSWVYGDTASGGQNMKLELEVRLSPSIGSGSVSGALYAGRKKIRDRSLSYAKRDWAVWEIEAGRSLPILRYPFSPGTVWKAVVGEDELEYRVEAADVRVETVAGNFDDCLKVREFNRRYPESWKYDYYAPGVGRVKTTIGGPGFENPNTELVKYSIGGG